MCQGWRSELAGRPERDRIKEQVLPEAHGPVWCLRGRARKTPGGVSTACSSGCGAPHAAAHGPRQLPPRCSPARVFIQGLLVALHKHHRWLPFLQVRHFLPGTEDHPGRKNMDVNTPCGTMKKAVQRWVVGAGLFKPHVIHLINCFDIFNN